MKKKYATLFLIFLFLLAVGSLVFFLRETPLAVMTPKGLIAAKEKDLMILTTLLMLLIVIPVLILTAAIAWKYRSGNTKAKYEPTWDTHLGAEIVWWGFPCAIVLVLGILTWKSCHDLDPFKPLDSPVKPLEIQVVALQWKWLFIYPEYDIATINYIQFPEKTPLNFHITADAPMNSFWIPQLGGQIYAMPGMNTKLHLIANEPGVFRGSSANLSGTGFAGMVFTAEASSIENFEKWVQSVKQSPQLLTLEAYNQLVPPSENNKIELFVLEKKDLYNEIIMKYMMPPQ